MYKKLLVPLDGSARAEVILPHVESLASSYEATITLLGIVEPEQIMVMEPLQYPIDLQNQERRAKEALNYLTSVQNRLTAKNLTVEVKVVESPVVEGIIETADEDETDLIMMVSHGRTGLARVFYGSVAAGVLHGVNRPLMIIRSLEHQQK
ncbi:universal stress protein [Anaerolineales bacterium HSG25]|nr:universal stress protein [Anaerolineales bacterium HSG25]